MRIVEHEFGRVLIRLRVEKSVEPIEPSRERPAIERPGRAALGQRRDVPLAEHVIAIAVRAQHFGERARLLRDLAAIAGEAGIEIGQTPHADRMMIAPGQERRARRRAHGGRVEAGVAQPLRRQPVDRRRGDGRAVAAEIREGDVVEQHDQNVRRARRRLLPLWPPRLRILDRLADPAPKRVRH